MKHVSQEVIEQLNKNKLNLKILQVFDIAKEEYENYIKRNKITHLSENYEAGGGYWEDGNVWYIQMLIIPEGDKHAPTAIDGPYAKCPIPIATIYVDDETAKARVISVEDFDGM